MKGKKGKYVLKEKAIQLRREGKTYSEILKEIAVAKSTISLWLREVGLSIPQKHRITEKKEAARLRAIQTIRNNKIKRIKNIKDIARSEVMSLIFDPLWITGSILYWGEGTKEHSKCSNVQITNMDVEVHRIFIKWAQEYLSVSEDDFIYEIYIHEKADIAQAQLFWAKELKIDRKRLRTYFKRHNPNPKRSHVGKDYNGVLKISILRSVHLNRRIAGWIEGIVLYLSK